MLRPKSDLKEHLFQEIGSEMGVVLELLEGKMGVVLELLEGKMGVETPEQGDMTHTVALEQLEEKENVCLEQ